MSLDVCNHPGVFQMLSKVLPFCHLLSDYEFKKPGQNKVEGSDSGKMLPMAHDIKLPFVFLPKMAMVNASLAIPWWMYLPIDLCRLEGIWVFP